MKKKQQKSFALVWVKGKINAAGAYLKTIERSALSWKIQKQKDTHLYGSLCILMNHTQSLRSFQ
jgi:hypothetical protein